MFDQVEGELSITTEGELVEARKTIRKVTTSLGIGVTDVTRIVTAVSELARNILRYAGSGQMKWRTLRKGDEVGIELMFVDHGPGIPDVNQAMQEGYSTSRGLGLGLPGAKRLMGELTVESAVGKGTSVTIRKWMKCA